MIKYYLCFKSQTSGEIHRSNYNFKREENENRDGFDSLTELLSFVRRSNEGSIIQGGIKYIIEKQTIKSEYME